MQEPLLRDLVAQALGSILDAPFNAARAGLARGPEHMLPGLLQQEHVDPTELPGIRDLPDQGPSLGPIHATPRTLAGFGADIGLGLLAGGGLKGGMHVAENPELLMHRDPAMLNLDLIMGRSSNTPSTAADRLAVGQARNAPGYLEGRTRPAFGSEGSAPQELGTPQRGSDLPLHSQPAEGNPAAYQMETQAPASGRQGLMSKEESERESVFRKTGKNPEEPSYDLSRQEPQAYGPDIVPISQLKAQAQHLGTRIDALLSQYPNGGADHAPSPALQQLIDDHQALLGNINDAEQRVRANGMRDIASQDYTNPNSGRTSSFRQDLFSERANSRNREGYYKQIPEIDEGTQSDVQRGFRRSPMDQFRTDDQGATKRFRAEPAQPGSGQRQAMVPDEQGDHGYVESFANQARTGARDFTRPQVTSTGNLRREDAGIPGVDAERARLMPPEALEDGKGNAVRDSRGRPVQQWDYYQPDEFAAQLKARDPRALAAYRTAVVDSVKHGFERDVERRAGTIYDRTHTASDPITSRFAPGSRRPDLESEVDTEGNVVRNTDSSRRIGSADTAEGSRKGGGSFNYLDERPASAEDQQFGSELARENVRDSWRARDSAGQVAAEYRQGRKPGRELPTFEEYTSDQGLSPNELADMRADYHSGTPEERQGHPYEQLRQDYEGRYGEGRDTRDYGSNIRGRSLNQRGKADLDAERAAADVEAHQKVIDFLQKALKDGTVDEEGGRAMLEDSLRSIAEAKRYAGAKSDRSDTLRQGTEQARQYNPGKQGAAPAEERTVTRKFGKPSHRQGEQAYADSQARANEIQRIIDQVHSGLNTMDVRFADRLRRRHIQPDQEYPF